MTIEKFKSDFEACERSQSYSDEFPKILNEVIRAFQHSNFSDLINNYFIGKNMNEVNFGYLSDASLFIVRESVFDEILSSIECKHKMQILAFCFSKYFQIEFNYFQNFIVCTPDWIEKFLDPISNELIDTDEEYVNTETGEIYNFFDYRLAIETIPIVYDNNLKIANTSIESNSSKSP